MCAELGLEVENEQTRTQKTQAPASPRSTPTAAWNPQSIAERLDMHVGVVYAYIAKREDNLAAAGSRPVRRWLYRYVIAAQRLRIGIDEARRPISEQAFPDNRRTRPHAR